MRPFSADPDALLQSAFDHLDRQQFALAESHARSALALVPDHPAPLGVLGYALHAQSRFDEAESVFSRLAEIEPGEGRHWMNIGTARRCAGRFDEALFAFARASALGASGADFFYNVALAHIDRSDYESARALLSKAFALAPNDAEICYRYAWCCYECLQTEEALAALSGWDATRVESRVAADVGHLLMKLGEPLLAEPTVRKAVQESSSDPRARLTFVQMLERTNRVSEAADVLDKLLADPCSNELGTDLIVTRAQLAQRLSQHTVACGLFSQALAECKELHNEHFLQYPLAKSLDSAGLYDEAFEMLVRAHKSQAAHLKLSAPVMAMRGAPALSIADFGCDPSDIALWERSNAPSVEESPIFVVAFPRSGTTLLELALDAHPMLRSMDEQPYLQNALDDVMNEGIEYPRQLAQLSQAQLANVRAGYWQRVSRKVTLPAGGRLIDKNPLNMLRLPLIARLFPNAHILMSIRHPCDVLLSCFMQHFRAPDFALLCQSLPALAVGYRKAFDFWYEQHALLAPNSREIRYEDFVANFDADMRGIIDFIQLPWNDAVLAPGARAQEKRFISTPSYSQVVEPVNQKAVGRWRNYERHFLKVLPIVQPYLRRWHYDAAG